MISSKNRILFRADGNQTIGLGHIVRCMALADSLKAEFEIVFLCRELTLAQKQIVLKSYSLIELGSLNLRDEINELEGVLIPSDILVLDGYSFDLSYQQSVRAMVKKLAIIDDLANREITADLIINHGGQFIVDKYMLQSGSKLLLGFKYLMVRQEFLEAKSVVRTVQSIRSVFICMGGADPFNITPNVIKACLTCSFIEKIIVVAGNAFTSLDEIKNIINSNSKTKIELHTNIGAQKMVDLIRETEIAICPSSSIALEICCVGCGMITGTVIDNQYEIHTQVLKNNCAISLGDFNTASITDISAKLNELNDVQKVNEVIQMQNKAVVEAGNNNLLREFKLLSHAS